MIPNCIFSRVSVRAILGISTLLVVGCVPIAGHYYEPSAEGGIQFRQACYSGARSNIKFNRSNVVILVQSQYEPDRNTYLSLDLQFHLKHDDQATVQWQELGISLVDGTKVLFDMGNNIYAYNLPLTRANLKQAHIPSLGPMIGREFAYYDIGLNITRQLPAQFILELPPMTINGVKYPATDILYTKKSGAWITPANC